MIVARIDGGLGNQMFQYAYGRYLADKHRSELVLDLRSFKHQPPHGFMLDRFQVGATLIDTTVIKRMPRAYQDVLSRSWLPDFLRSTSLRRIKERPFGFHEKYLRAGDDSYLVGYWQSEKFFPGQRDALLQEFQLRFPVGTDTKRVVEQMHGVRSIALHIRRGDYVTNPEAARIYESIGVDYYRRCLELWAEQYEGVEVFIFSNDLAWCRKRFMLPWKTHFVDHVAGRDAHEDLIMLSHSQAVAIANSTFSWWAAYLNQRVEKRVFAPSHWFRPNTLDASNIYPSDWQVIDGFGQDGCHALPTQRRAA
jgi:Glycosyl transferase family 11